jgi:hypothetical protein
MYMYVHFGPTPYQQRHFAVSHVSYLVSVRNVSVKLIDIGVSAVSGHIQMSGVLLTDIKKTSPAKQIGGSFWESQQGWVWQEQECVHHQG